MYGMFINIDQRRSLVYQTKQTQYVMINFIEHISMVTYKIL